MMRITSRKASIGEIINGKYIKKTGFQSSYVLTNLGRRLSRVRILGALVDKFISPDEKFGSVTIDDGNGTLRCKAFVNIKLFENVKPGDFVDIFGKVKEYNSEIYVVPEIIRKIEDSNFETLRILELEKIYTHQKEIIKKIKGLNTKDIEKIKAAISDIPQDDIEAIIELEDVPAEPNGKPKDSSPKETILNLIDQLDKGEGVVYQDLIKASGLKDSQADSAIQDLLESGTCFEPKPGKIKRL